MDLDAVSTHAELAAALRALHDERGRSYLELGTDAGVSQSTVHAAVSGKSFHVLARDRFDQGAGSR